MNSSNKPRIGCLFYYWGPRYKKIGKLAVDSFKKFHPDVEIHIVDEKSREEYSSSRLIERYGLGPHKFMLALEIMLKHKYDKLMLIGADTITCSRLDGFLNSDEDVIVTLDYPYQVGLAFIRDFSGLGGTISNVEMEIVYSPIILHNKETSQYRLYFGSVAKLPDLLKKESDEGGILENYLPRDYFNFNADIVCFNNPAALKKLIDVTAKYHDTHQLIHSEKEKVFYLPDDMKSFTGDYYGEQGGLNIFCSLSLSPDPVDKGYNFSIGVADAYFSSNVVYNVRSKGNRNLFEKNDDPDIIKKELKPWGPFLKKWSTDKDKLFDCNKRQIKVFHYCDGFGSMDDEKFCQIMNKYVFDWFTDETKEFFKKHCNSGDFFDKEFTLD